MDRKPASASLLAHNSTGLGLLSHRNQKVCMGRGPHGGSHPGLGFLQKLPPGHLLLEPPPRQRKDLGFADRVVSCSGTGPESDWTPGQVTSSSVTRECDGSNSLAAPPTERWGERPFSGHPGRLGVPCNPLRLGHENATFCCLASLRHRCVGPSCQLQRSPSGPRGTEAPANSTHDWLAVCRGLL